MAWVNNYIQLFKVDVITHPCPDPEAGLANLCYQKGPQISSQD